MFETSQLFERYPNIDNCRPDLEKALQMLIYTFEQKGKLLVMGNGGSSADAEHLCGELVKSFLKSRPLSSDEKAKLNDAEAGLGEQLHGGLPAISLGVMHGFSTAFANDCDPQYVYAQQVWVLAHSSDIVMGISTSGNSKNVIHAISAAKAKKIPTILLTGADGGLAAPLADVAIKAPAEAVHEIQELHLPIYHALCIELEHHFFKS